MVNLIPPFKTFRNSKLWETYIERKLKAQEKNISDYLKYWYIESQDNERAYPSQGMLTTPFDFLETQMKGMLPPERMIKLLRVRQYFLELFNHPKRIQALKSVQGKKFQKPPKLKSNIMQQVIEKQLAISINDLGISIVGSAKERVSRTKRLAAGPFIKLGKRARSLFVGSAMPDTACPLFLSIFTASPRTPSFPSCLGE